MEVALRQSLQVSGALLSFLDVSTLLAAEATCTTCRDRVRNLDNYLFLPLLVSDLLPLVQVAELNDLPAVYLLQNIPCLPQWIYRAIRSGSLPHYMSPSEVCGTSHAHLLDLLHWLQISLLRHHNKRILAPAEVVAPRLFVVTPRPVRELAVRVAALRDGGRELSAATVASEPAQRSALQRLDTAYTSISLGRSRPAAHRVPMGPGLACGSLLPPAVVAHAARAAFSQRPPAPRSEKLLHPWNASLTAQDARALSVFPCAYLPPSVLPQLGGDGQSLRDRQLRRLLADPRGLELSAIRTAIVSAAHSADWPAGTIVALRQALEAHTLDNLSLDPQIGLAGVRMGRVPYVKHSSARELYRFTIENIKVSLQGAYYSHWRRTQSDMRAFVPPQVVLGLQWPRWVWSALQAFAMGFGVLGITLAPLLYFALVYTDIRTLREGSVEMNNFGHDVIVALVWDLPLAVFSVVAWMPIDSLRRFQHWVGYTNFPNLNSADDVVFCAYGYLLLLLCDSIWSLSGYGMLAFVTNSFPITDTPLVGVSPAMQQAQWVPVAVWPWLRLGGARLAPSRYQLYPHPAWGLGEDDTLMMSPLSVFFYLGFRLLCGVLLKGLVAQFLQHLMTVPARFRRRTRVGFWIGHQTLAHPFIHMACFLLGVLAAGFNRVMRLGDDFGSLLDCLQHTPFPTTFPVPLVPPTEGPDREILATVGAFVGAVAGKVKNCTMAAEYPALLWLELQRAEAGLRGALFGLALACGGLCAWVVWCRGLAWPSLSSLILLAGVCAGLACGAHAALDPGIVREASATAEHRTGLASELRGRIIRPAGAAWQGIAKDTLLKMFPSFEAISAAAGGRSMRAAIKRSKRPPNPRAGKRTRARLRKEILRERLEGRDSSALERRLQEWTAEHDTFTPSPREAVRAVSCRLEAKLTRVSVRTAVTGMGMLCVLLSMLLSSVVPALVGGNLHTAISMPSAPLPAVMQHGLRCPIHSMQDWVLSQAPNIPAPPLPELSEELLSWAAWARQAWRAYTEAVDECFEFVWLPPPYKSISHVVKRFPTGIFRNFEPSAWDHPALPRRGWAVPGCQCDAEAPRVVSWEQLLLPEYLSVAQMRPLHDIPMPMRPRRRLAPSQELLRMARLRRAWSKSSGTCLVAAKCHWPTSYGGRAVASLGGEVPSKAPQVGWWHFIDSYLGIQHHLERAWTNLSGLWHALGVYPVQGWEVELPSTQDSCDLPPEWGSYLPAASFARERFLQCRADATERVIEHTLLFDAPKALLDLRIVLLFFLFCSLLTCGMGMHEQYHHPFTQHNHPFMSLFTHDAGAVALVGCLASVGMVQVIWALYTQSPTWSFLALFVLSMCLCAAAIGLFIVFFSATIDFIEQGRMHDLLRRVGLDPGDVVEWIGFVVFIVAAGCGGALLVCIVACGAGVMACLLASVYEASVADPTGFVCRLSLDPYSATELEQDLTYFSQVVLRFLLGDLQRYSIPLGDHFVQATATLTNDRFS